MRLKDEHRLFIIQQLAMCKTYKQTASAFEEKYGAKLWDGQIKMVKEQHADDITELRRQWNDSIIEIGVYNIRRKMELLDETAERGLNWYFEGDSLVYVKNEAFNPEKPVSAKNKPYIEQKVPRYKCHPEWTLRAVELAAELVNGKTFKHRIFSGNSNESFAFDLTINRGKPPPSPPGAATQGKAAKS